MPSFVIVYASPVTVRFYQDRDFRKAQNLAGRIAAPEQSYGILGSRPVAPDYLFRITSKLSIAQRHRKSFP